MPVRAQRSSGGPIEHALPRQVSRASWSPTRRSAAQAKHTTFPSGGDRSRQRCSAGRSVPVQIASGGRAVVGVISSAGAERGGFVQAYDPALGVPETVRSEFADGERGGVSLGFGRRGQEFAELGVGDSIEI